MKISYYLRGKSPISAGLILRINHGEFVVRNGKKAYRPFEFRLPFDINPKYWLAKKQRSSESYEYTDGTEINMYLDKLDSALRNYISTNRFNGEQVTGDGLKMVALQTFGFDYDKEIRYFSDVIQRMIDESEGGKRLAKNGNRIGTNTIRKYYNALRHLENYEKRMGRVILRKVDKLLAQNLQTYFNDAGLAQNTKATQFNVYRTAVNYAVDKGLVKDVSFKEVSVPEVVTDAIALTEEEVKRIFELKLDDEVLRKHRDIFIVGIWSMLRFSDYSKLEEMHVVENGTLLKLFAQKTQRPVYIPIHWQMKEIIERYDYRLPHLSHVQHFNRSLKKIGEQAGIVQAIEVRVFKGGRVTKKVVSRYELISSHTARRTGATLLYLAGIHKERLKPLTDHTTDENFDRYIRVEKYANAKALTKHKFFQKPDE